ncbi:MAG: glutamate-5-semialdehyde dehydrogenase [Spirulinaceae cyanobacterium RM2_2_10]|nr:glutamate-5-semialdehyde dehydrogenase [Spirulinaceae cyanobacterium RM2_2_10]
MDSPAPTPATTHPILAAVQRTHQTAATLAGLGGSDRNRGIAALANELEASLDGILEANTLDLEICREMAIPDLIQDWLKLTPERLQRAITTLRRLTELSDPTLRIVAAPYQHPRAQTYCQPMPLGTIALIYEAFPELGAIAAGLCLKTGNSLVLRGGSESSQTNRVIATVLQNALSDARLPETSVTLFSADDGIAIQDLVTRDHWLNLVIPYGRAGLVQQVAQSATVPVLRAALGNSYLYCSPSGDLEFTRWLILDSRGREPDPVNAIEKVLLCRSHSTPSLPRLFHALHDQGFELRGDRELCDTYPDQLRFAADSEWSSAYLRKVVAFKLVDDIEAAIAWMNRYSSGHADCLVTGSYLESRRFAMNINSASVYINASPRFSRNPPQGNAVFLGVSNQKGQRRGPIGLESLTTLKQVVQGSEL